MKKIMLFLFMVFSVMLIVGCTAPPEDATRATVGGEDTDVDTSEEVSPAEPAATDDEVADTPIDNADVASEEVSGTDTEEKVAIDLGKSSFAFIGYGPGKSHEGTFDTMSGNLILSDGSPIGMEGTIDVSSVNTGIGGLDAHLLRDDFFDVEKYPEIKFVSESIGNNILTGDLTFHGVTETVSFPVTLTADSISADFVLDTTPFGMTNGNVNKEVTITFTFSR